MSHERITMQSALDAVGDARRARRIKGGKDVLSENEIRSLRQASVNAITSFVEQSIVNLSTELQRTRPESADFAYSDDELHTWTQIDQDSSLRDRAILPVLLSDAQKKHVSSVFAHATAINVLLSEDTSRYVQVSFLYDAMKAAEHELLRRDTMRVRNHNIEGVLTARKENYRFEARRECAYKAYDSDRRYGRGSHEPTQQEEDEYNRLIAELEAKTEFEQVSIGIALIHKHNARMEERFRMSNLGSRSRESYFNRMGGVLRPTPEQQFFALKIIQSIRRGHVLALPQTLVLSDDALGLFRAISVKGRMVDETGKTLSESDAADDFLRGVRIMLKSDPELVYRLHQLLPEVRKMVMEKYGWVTAAQEKLQSNAVPMSFEQAVASRHAEAIFSGLVTYFMTHGIPLSIAAYLTAYMAQDVMPLILARVFGHADDVLQRMTTLENQVAFALQEWRRKEKL